MTEIEQWVTDLNSYPITGFDPKAGRYINIPLISQITDSLFVGGCEPYLNLPDFIDHVVSMYKWGEYRLNEEQTRDTFTMYDSEGPVDIDTVNAAVASALEALNEGKTVLIHCQAGINRSNLVASIVLMKHLDITAVEAVSLLREKRDPYILSNTDFEQYVRGLDTVDMDTN